MVKDRAWGTLKHGTLIEKDNSGQRRLKRSIQLGRKLSEGRGTMEAQKQKSFRKKKKNSELEGVDQGGDSQEVPPLTDALNVDLQ